MKFLLDTHILLWWLNNDKKLAAFFQSTIANPKNIIFVSTASAWEMSIKAQVGKLDVPDNLEEALAVNRFIVLPINLIHSIKVSTLPLHHKDPFDRMLIAQALTEDLMIITVDKKFKFYDVSLLAI